MAPRHVARREVRLHVEARRQGRAHQVDQRRLGELGLLERQLRQRAQVEEVLAAHDVVDPLLGDLEFAQVVGQEVAILAGEVVGR